MNSSKNSFESFGSIFKQADKILVQCSVDNTGILSKNNVFQLVINDSLSQEIIKIKSWQELIIYYIKYELTSVWNVLILFDVSLHIPYLHEKQFR